jgi:hypothetical protein
MYFYLFVTGIKHVNLWTKKIVINFSWNNTFGDRVRHRVVTF